MNFKFFKNEKMEEQFQRLIKKLKFIDTVNC